MVQFTILLSSFLAVSGVWTLPNTAIEARGALTGPPADHPHGIYTIDHADDGSTVWTFVAPINETLKVTDLVARSINDIEKRDSTNCAGFGTPTANVNLAQGNLANQCGNGYFFTGKAIAAYYGSGVAYACNYGKNGQTCHYNDVWGDFAKINTQCGFNPGGDAGAGWVYHSGWKASYGRTSSSTGFC